MFLESGYGKSTAITFEKMEAGLWVTMGVYFPRYCPNCGRKLVENEKKKDR